MMKKIGFITNMDKDSDLSVTKELIAFANQRGLTSFAPPDIRRRLQLTNVNASENLCVDVDFLLVLGGDGTVLRAAADAAVFNTPLLGVNMGNLGYLTDVEVSGAKGAIESVLDGNYIIEKRMMLEAEISGVDNKNKISSSPLIALNEICITRGAFIKLIECEVRINGEYIDTYEADGLIVCTATGSTAYNLSAGGPILKPDSEMTAVTPICPHSLHARSLVVSPGDVIEVTVGKNVDGYGDPCLKNEKEMLIGNIVSIDGRSVCGAGNGETIIIRRSRYYTSVIKTNQFGFYDILRHKMLRK